MAINIFASLRLILPSVVAMYAKRLMETPCSYLADTKTFKKLMDLPEGTKRGAEFVTYVLISIADMKLVDGTPLRRFLRDVGVAFAPEMARRMLNGPQIREAFQKAPVTAKQRAILNSLLEVKSDEELSELVHWIFDRGPRQWQEAVASTESKEETDSRIRGWTKKVNAARSRLNGKEG